MLKSISSIWSCACSNNSFAMPPPVTAALGAKTDSFSNKRLANNIQLHGLVGFFFPFLFVFLGLNGTFVIQKPFFWQVVNNHSWIKH